VVHSKFTLQSFESFTNQSGDLSKGPTRYGVCMQGKTLTNSPRLSGF
jgi:hypothetical protein